MSAPTRRTEDVAPDRSVRSWCERQDLADGSPVIVNVGHQVRNDGEWVELDALIEAWRAR